MLNSNVSDHSTVILKGFGLKRVLCDCFRYCAMANMLILFKKADRTSGTEYAKVKKFFY